MLKWLRAYRPTRRELLWFALWIVVIAAIYRDATQFTYSLPSDSTETPTPTVTTNLHVEPTSSPAPTKRRLVQSTATPATTSAALNQPPALKQPEPLRQPERVAPKTYGTSDHPKGWVPDRENDKGDARIVYAEEVVWLQEQLAKIQVTRNVAAEFQLAHVGQLTKQIGAMPYAAELHGWGLPEQTLARNVGDCQDKSLLLATRLIASGVREVAICRGVGPNYKPGEAGHAWVQTTIAGVLWRLESTSGDMSRANSGSKLDAFESVLTVWNLAKP